jgi:hypothetical protein
MALRAVVRQDFLESIRPMFLISLLKACEPLCERHHVGFSEADTSDPGWIGRVHKMLNREQPQPITQALLQIRDLSSDPDIDYFADDLPPEDHISPLTPAERALLVHLREPDQFQRAYLAAMPAKPCRFLEFISPKPAPFDAETPNRVLALQQALAEWFERKRCTRFCEVHVLQTQDEVRWGIIHGRKPRRYAFIQSQEESVERKLSTRYPDQHDLAVLCLKTGRLLIHARGADEIEQYRRLLGDVYWGDTEHFVVSNIYSLAPFQLRGDQLLSCVGVEGLRKVELRQLDLKKPQSRSVLFSLRGQDLVGDTPDGTIHRFLRDYDVHCVKLACFVDGHEEPRVVTIRPPNRVALDLRLDNGPVIRFLVSKGLMTLDPRQASLFGLHGG